MKPSAFRRFLQIGTFLRKEAVDVLRQPRLLLTMVIGPFLIMALFGLGYRETPKKMDTLFVAPEGSPLLDQVQKYADELDEFVDYQGSTSDEAFARKRLLDGDIDLIVSFPDAPLETVLGGEQAEVTVIHARLDPVEQTAISFASRIGIDEINSQILSAIVEGGQELTDPVGNVFDAADVALSAAETAAAEGDTTASAAAMADLADATSRMLLTVRASAALSEGLGAGGEQVAAEITAPLDEIRTLVRDLENDPSPENVQEKAPRLRELLGVLREDFQRFATVDPNVLVRPLDSDVQLAVGEEREVTDWYAPAAVVLMLQQFGVAFGALSFVRERRLGIVDVYRVAPVNAGATLIGKYAAYMLIGSAIAAVLTALVAGVLGVEISSSVGDIAVVMALNLFASIGVGFVISLASATDAQAVQYTMIVLLASLFFSGFFLSVEQLEDSAKVMSLLLPVTYAMRLLRDVMLLGAPLDENVLGGLALYGAVMFVLALLGARRRMSIARSRT